MSTSGFWVRIKEGLKGKGSSGSVDNAESGLELMIAHTSAMKVTRTSCVRCPLWCNIMESSILLVTPIILSHTPPMWGECGALKIHRILLSLRNGFTESSLTWMLSIFNSSTAPSKFVPQSERIILSGPLTEINLLSALMIEDELSSSTTSRWTPRVVKQVKIMAQRFEFAARYNSPRPKSINANIGKWWSWNDAIFR